MSIFLNRDDINNIDSEKTQRKILAAISEHIKEFAAITPEIIEIDVFPVTGDQLEKAVMFTKNSGFLDLVGSFDGPPDLAKGHDNYLME
jgi:hypothetical protein